MVELPLEIVQAVKALHDDNRFEILYNLYESEEIPFSQIGELTELKSSNLTYHLQALVDSGLVENFFKRIESANSYSFYRITNFGKRFIDSLFRILVPGPILIEHRRIYEKETTVKETWTDEVIYINLPPISIKEKMII